MARATFSSLVDCSKVEVRADAYGGAGAFAAVDVMKGEVVEQGIVRVLTNVDGNENPYVFTWSHARPCNTCNRSNHLPTVALKSLTE